MVKPSKSSTRTAVGGKKTGSNDAANKSKKTFKSSHRDLSLVLPSRITIYTTPPLNWPSNMPYLSIALQSQSLAPSQQLTLHPTILPLPATDIYSIPSLAAFSPTRNPLIQILPITSPTHPAYPQFGLFAAKLLQPGTHIVDYTGSIHACPQPTCSTSDYDLAFLDRDASIAIDGSSMGNEGRFVNDYHGIRDQGPNAVFEEYYVKVKSPKGRGEIWQARMGIWVAPVSAQPESLRSTYKGISKGEEICVSYGKGWWRARRGLMEEQNEELEQEAEDCHG